MEELHARIVAAMANLPQYEFEHIYIDNASTDKTVAILRRMVQEDKRIRVIVNARNFGHIRSPYHALIGAKGDAVICLASDLQDPPELIVDFIQQWEAGFKVVMGVKSKSEESPVMFALRKLYYKTLQKLSDTQLIENYTGYGLYDHQVIEILREMDDPYPYFRGMIAEIGFPAARIEFTQPTRKHGITKNNFYTLFDMAMLGMTNYSKVPLRLATMFGFVVAVFSALIGLFYFVYKLLNWQNFSVGSAPVTVGLFFFGAVQLFFLGILGEYIGAIYTHVLHRPLVVEKERINYNK